MTSFNGVRVIESAYLEQDGTPVTVRRSWRERLFSRPWRPLVATRVVVPRVPYRGALRLNATTLVMHPETFRQMRESLQSVDAVDPHARRTGTPTTRGSFVSSCVFTDLAQTDQP